MSYIEGECREQTTLFPESVEDFVDANHPVRFIDAFVDSLVSGVVFSIFASYSPIFKVFQN